MTVQRGEIYFVNLNPVQGREQAGNRPVLVLSVDAINRLPLVVTVVVGTKGENVSRDYPTNVRVGPAESGLGKRSLPRGSLLVVGADCRPARRRGPGRLGLRPADRAPPSARALNCRSLEVAMVLRPPSGSMRSARVHAWARRRAAVASSHKYSRISRKTTVFRGARLGPWQCRRREDAAWSRALAMGPPISPTGCSGGPTAARTTCARASCRCPRALRAGDPAESIYCCSSATTRGVSTTSAITATTSSFPKATGACLGSTTPTSPQRPWWTASVAPAASPLLHPAQSGSEAGSYRGGESCDLPRTTGGGASQDLLFYSSKSRLSGLAWETGFSCHADGCPPSTALVVR